MARNFKGVATNDAATLTITGTAADEVYVKNTGGSGLLVNVPAVHGASDFDTLAPGETERYEAAGAVTSIVVKTETTGQTAGYTAGVTRGAA